MNQTGGDRGTAMATTRAQRVLFALLFVAACLFLGRASVFQSQPTVNAELYVQGHAQMPFQGRFLMVPVVRYLLQSGRLARIHLGTLSSVGIGFALINSVCFCLLGLLSLHLGRLLGLARGLYYLPCLLTLLTLALNCCVHQEWAFYIYYDFPGYVFFAAGLWAIVTRRTWLFVAIALAGMVNKETVLLLVPVWAAWQLQDEAWHPRLLGRRWKVFAAACALGFVLLLEQKIAVHLTGYDRTAVGLDRPWALSNFEYLAPWHLPQVLSVLGFSVPIAYLYSRLLPRAVWSLLMGLVPGFLVLFYAGIPMENRVYGEFAIVLALALSFEWEAYMQRAGFAG